MSDSVDLLPLSLVIPWALLVIALIVMRVIAHMNGVRLPIFYWASRQSERLDPDRLRRYRSLRSAGLAGGVLIILLGALFSVLTDAPHEISILFNTVGLLAILSSALYLEYCLATGLVPAPASD